MLVIGCDPGRKGGISFIYGSVVLCHRMPEDEDGIAHLIRQHVGDRSAFAVVEKHWARPTRDTADADTIARKQFRGAKGTGVLLTNMGIILGVLAGLGIKRVNVIPQTWMKKLGCQTGHLEKGKKRFTCDFAKQLYPGVKLNQDTAESLLLAHYGRCFYPEGPR